MSNEIERLGNLVALVDPVEFDGLELWYSMSQSSRIRSEQKETNRANKTIELMKARALASADVGRGLHIAKGPRTFEDEHLQKAYNRELARVLLKQAAACLPDEDMDGY